MVLELEPERVIVQVEVPLQPAPLQPEKMPPLLGVAVSVTGTPSVKALAQATPPVELQPVIPLGLELTEPLPETVTKMMC